MDNIWEAVAILLLIIFSGLGELSKRMRKKSQKTPPASPQPIPARPQTNPARSRQEAMSPFQEWTEPEHDEPDFREPHFDEPKYGGPEYDGPEYGEPEYGEPRETVLPMPKKSDPVSDIFRELFDIGQEEVVIVDEPVLTPPPQPVAPRPQRDFFKKQEKKQIERKLEAQTAVSAPRSFLSDLAVRAQKEPLKAAVIFSEILQRPKPGIPIYKRR